MPHCELCSQHFTTYFAVKRHTELQHGGSREKHSCPHCPDKSYGRADSLARHMKTHHQSSESMLLQIDDAREVQVDVSTAPSTVEGEENSTGVTTPIEWSYDTELDTDDEPVDDSPTTVGWSGPCAGSWAGNPCISPTYAESVRPWDDEPARLIDTGTVLPPKLHEVGIMPVTNWPSTTDTLPSPPTHVFAAIALLQSMYTHVKFQTRMEPFVAAYDGQHQRLWRSRTLDCPDHFDPSASIVLVPTITCTCCPKEVIVILDFEVIATFRAHSETPTHLDGAVARLQMYRDLRCHCIWDAVNDIISNQGVHSLKTAIDTLERALTTRMNPRLLNVVDKLCLTETRKNLLTLTIERGCLDSAEFLLSSGLDCHRADTHHHTALHWACYWGNLSATRMIIGWDASTLSDKDADGHQPFDLALQNFDRTFAANILDSQPPAPDSGACAFYALAKYGSPSHVQKLFENRAKIEPPLMHVPKEIERPLPYPQLTSRLKLEQLRILEHQEALRLVFDVAPACVVHRLLMAGAYPRAGLGKLIRTVRQKTCRDALEKVLLLCEHDQAAPRSATREAEAENYHTAMQRLLDQRPADATQELMKLLLARTAFGADHSTA